MAANEIGPRGKYKYIMDDGTVIKLRLDSTLGDIASCGLTPITTADNAGNKPTNFKPRVVFWTHTKADGSKMSKQLVCASDSAAFKSKDNFSITIDGLAGQTTGRRGEQISF